MADRIIDDLSELLQQDLVVQAGTVDNFGTFTPAGSAVTVKCRVVEKTTSVRLPTGEEVPSRAKVQARLDDTDGNVLILTPDTHRYTLPVGCAEPRQNLKALIVKRPHDENGPHHHVVFF